MYQRVMIVIDDRPVSQSCILQGLELSRVHQATAVFLYLLPKISFIGLDALSIADIPDEALHIGSRAHGERILSAAREAAEDFGIHSFGLMGLGEDNVQCVVDAAKAQHCDIIVVGTEGRNAVVRLLTGSIVPGLISQATVPVLVCREMGSIRGYGRRTAVALRAKLKRDELAARRLRGAEEDTQK